MEEILRTLLHPKMMMASLAVLALHVGGVTVVHEPDTIDYPLVWGTVFLASGLAGLAAIFHPAKALIALSGSLLSVAFMGRGVAVLETVLDDKFSPSLEAAAVIGVAQWFTLAYATWFIWRRIVVPWSVIERG